MTGGGHVESANREPWAISRKSIHKHGNQPVVLYFHHGAKGVCLGGQLGRVLMLGGTAGEHVLRALFICEASNSVEEEGLRR